jgi:hypothetical protein
VGVYRIQDDSEFYFGGKIIYCMDKLLREDGAWKIAVGKHQALPLKLKKDK